MNDAGYHRILDALDEGRRALTRARITAGMLRFLGVGLATLAGLVLWAALQRALRMYNVPVATGASLLGAGIMVFALVRWLVIPLVRLPNRDDFVTLVERKFPNEKNILVNAYQLGDSDRESQGRHAPDLVAALIARASERVGTLDLNRWRDPAPDRPYLWAGGAALGAMALLGLLAPALLTGALGQVVRPDLALPPAVVLTVNPGDIEVDRGSDVPISVRVDGTGKAPVLQFRERNGAWRTRELSPKAETVHRDGGEWESMLPQVDRNLEYRVAAPRAESDLFTIVVREPPRLSGFRAHLDYPDYTGLPTETLTSGTGDLTALKGTQVDLHVLTNQNMASAYLDWRPDGKQESRRRDLTAGADASWHTRMAMDEPASYAVVLTDVEGKERLRSPRYRVDPAPDRNPFLTLHFPQEDHDLADDMMERVVADAADDFGFSAVRIRYRVDEGPERSVRYTPYTAGQREFRLDTMWDLSGLDLLPGSEVSYYLEVRDNDTVSGPKAVRSPVRRVRFPTMTELYEEVAEDHNQEIDSLSDVKEAQEDLREKLQKLESELKQGKELDWEMRKDVERTMEKQQAVEQQVSEIVDRLQETLDKAANRAQMNQDLVQKMSEINELLDSVADENLKRSFRELAQALEKMDRDAIRRALEDFQMSQEQMLQGMDRTIELLKQVRREEQIADVVQRTEEIARLQDEIAKELEKLGAKQRQESETAEAEKEQTGEGEDGEGENEDGENKDGEGENKDGESQESEDGSEDGESQPGEDQEGESQSGENQSGENQDGENQSSGESSESEENQESGEGQEGEPSSQQEKEKTEEELAKESKSGSQSSEPSGGQQSESGDSSSQDEKERLKELAKEQERAEELVEELKRQLEMLRKLNEDQPEMAQDLEEMSKSQAAQQLQDNMQQAQQNMKGGQKQPAADYAFKARDQANSLKGMASSMQQQMQQNFDDRAVELVEKVIQGLIDVSFIEEELLDGAGSDARLLAQRQFNLTESTLSLAETLAVAMKTSFELNQDKVGKLGKAIANMERTTNYFERGNRRKAEHQARESVAEVNETIVQLMQAHSQMCNKGGSGQSSQQMQEMMQGLSQSQEQLNKDTKQMLEKMAGEKRLSMSEQQRMAQLAAQQEMVRQGLKELQEQFGQAKDLLGDLDQVQKDMEEVERELTQKQVDPRVRDRQQQILSRLLDAQRSIRQREMSPERQSRHLTLAERRSPPPIPEHLLRSERTLEEDVLRGADDRYPAQYRQLVEEYFRALSRQSRNP